MSDAIGMMDGAYFVSRTELLNWLNSTFQLNYSKVEQCCSAAAHCQIIDGMFPGTVALDKVAWDAKSEYQYVANFKILQKAFDRNDIKRHIDVDKLVRGKYQDNLEFLQWIKAYFDMKKGQLDADYDPVERRSCSPSAKKMDKAAGAAPSKPGAGGGGAAAAPRPRATNPRPTPAAGGVAAGRAAGGGGADKKRVEELEAELDKMKLQEQEDQLNIESLVKERDFYFRKLRDIEILCQQLPDPKPEIILNISDILYATEEGFETPEAQ